MDWQIMYECATRQYPLLLFDQLYASLELTPNFNRFLRLVAIFFHCFHLHIGMRIFMLASRSRISTLAIASFRDAC